ncbi:MAG: cytochrome o ubiquinol oxidase subunit IV [Stappiaceae bacterium]
MTRESTHSYKSYITGFVLALTLTLIPFGLVWSGTLPQQTTLAVIAICALIQVPVHLYFFLHLNFQSTPTENLLALAFACILIVLMVGGSLWIMFDLHNRMMM